MKKLTLATVVLLLASATFPSTAALAETSTQPTKTETSETTETDAQAAIENPLTGTIPSATADTTETPETSDTDMEEINEHDIPSITGVPEMRYVPYKNGFSAPEKIIVSLTDQSQEELLQGQDAFHSYIDASGITERYSANFPVPSADDQAIHLAVYSGNTEKEKQQIQTNLAYYAAKLIKTYHLGLENLDTVLSIDDSFFETGLSKQAFNEAAAYFYPNITPDTTITSMEETELFTHSEDEIGLFDSPLSPENHSLFSGNGVVTKKAGTSAGETFFFVETADQSGWISETDTIEPVITEREPLKGTVASDNVKVYEQLPDFWKGQPSAQTLTKEMVLQAEKQIDFPNDTLYFVTQDGKPVGYIAKTDLQVEQKSADEQNTVESVPESSEPSSEKTTETQSRAEITARSVQAPAISYSTHVRLRGWLPFISGGTSGTTGQGLQVEGFRINLQLPSNLSGSIQYTSFVPGTGWQNWVSNGQISGTTGQNQRIEGINLRLTGEVSNRYSISYRVHVQKLGWLPWTSNGNPAGSLGFDYRIEAIEVRLSDRNKEAPPLGNAYVEKEPSVLAVPHVARLGWLSETDGISQVGTVGQGLSLQALRLRLTNNTIGGDITYQSHLAGTGWESRWASGSRNEQAGTTGQNRPIEAIRIQLTGTISTQYDVYYRTHVQHFGWLGWAKNGEDSGTQGFSYRTEAIQVVLVRKGGPAPGSTANAFYLAAPRLTLNGHVSGIGWTSRQGVAPIIDFSNQNRQFEAIQARFENNRHGGSIVYESHLATTGWTNAVRDGATSGTTGQKRSLQAFSFQLTGGIAEHYTIYYRAFVRSRGWLGWAENGQRAGSVQLSLPVEAIQVSILPKDRRPSGFQANQLALIGQVNTSTPEGRFVNSIAPAARRVSSAHGLFASVMMAQAILESGYGTSVLASRANNFFGVKFTPGVDEGRYDYIWHVSNEVINGVTVPVNSRFRVYRTFDESMLDNAVKLRYGPNWDPLFYSGAWRVNAPTFRDATRALTGRYATDPLYDVKLNNIIERWALYQFD
jgi:uncharacterized protein YjdB